jgi:hypothetical protein
LNNILDSIPSTLLEDIIENRCIPIIGAGFSRNASTKDGKVMPLWNNLANKFSEQLGKDYKFSNPLDPISDFSYNFGKAKCIEWLRKMLYHGDIQPSSAQLAFANLPFDIVITTNFDSLLESSYHKKGRRYIVITDEKQLSTSDVGLRNNDETTRILKIHGDIGNARTMILTEEDYDSYINDHPLMVTFISFLLVTRTPLLIGYSLDDPDFRLLWQIIRTRLDKLQRHAYSLVIDTNNAKITKYTRRGVNVIKIGTNYEF